jgi:ABC-2 type transport system permease protein
VTDRQSLKMMRIRAMLRKELLDLARNRAALLPVVITTIVSLLIPFFVIVMLPAMTGRSLAGDPALELASRGGGHVSDVPAQIRVPVFLFQQFLILFMLTPITGAMSLAAHAVVGEKQNRTLEPLLATPLTTIELLVAKVLGALLPTFAISSAGLIVYLAGIVLWEPRTAIAALLTGRTLVLALLVGPAAALVSLQSAIVISSRVNDPRTAQQFGVLIVVPLTFVFVGQLVGALWLPVWLLAGVGLAMLVAWVLLTLFTVALFDRETILTRWR